MASIDEIRAVRIEKMNKLRATGMDPYPVSVLRDITISDLKAQFSDLESKKEALSIAGRILSIRGQGAIFFVTLSDGGDRFQAVFKKDEIDPALFVLFGDAVDLGDFISVSGTLFITQRGEQSILVKNWMMASKALLSIPTEHFGIEDEDERLRKRYLDAITDPQVFQRFEIRSQIIKYIRAFFDAKNFLEIETPILQNQAGGAMAKTFTTNHNDYDMDMVLRISLELEHKIMMAAGYDRVYEIGKNFRNEGSDPTHIQEFTMMEWYAAYETLETNARWTEELIRGIARDVIGKNIFKTHNKGGDEVEISFEGKWPRVYFADLVKEHAGIDIFTATLDEIKTSAEKYGMSSEEITNTGKANLLDFIYKKSARNNIINPTLVFNYPIDLVPLAQRNPDGTASMFQLIIDGAEITKCFAELVDPITERELLQTQSRAKALGDTEAMEIDERFLSAMEYGMPPMTGFGMGIDRLVALLTEQSNLRDVIFFPIMKPKE